MLVTIQYINSNQQIKIDKKSTQKKTRELIVQLSSSHKNSNWPKTSKSETNELPNYKKDTLKSKNHEWI